MLGYVWAGKMCACAQGHGKICCGQLDELVWFFDSHSPPARAFLLPTETRNLKKVTLCSASIRLGYGLEKLVSLVI